MTKKQKIDAVVTIVCFLVFLLAKFVFPTPEGMTKGILLLLISTASAIIMWMVIGVGWTSMYVLCTLMMIPELGAAWVAQNSIGNSVVYYFMTCFILASCLISTGVAKRIAVLLMVNKYSRKSPWMNVIMIFLGVFILSQGMSSPSVLLIFFPILYEIFDMCGYKKGDAAPAFLILGCAIISQACMTMTPIAHAVAATGISTYLAYSGYEISVLEFSLLGIPTGIAMCVLYVLACRFFWNPDLSKLAHVDHDAIASSIGPVTRKEQFAIIGYGLILLFWILPGLGKFVPFLSPLAKLNTTVVSLIGMSALCVIHVDGEPILDYNRALKTDVPWAILMFISAIQVLGAAMSHKDIGFAAWLGAAMEPVFAHVSPMLFLILILAFCVISTNFLSNGVTLALALAIGLPLTDTLYAGQFSPIAMVIMCAAAANAAFATPPASHAPAMALATGYVDIKTLVKWGGIASVGAVISYWIIGIPLANIFF